MTRDPIRLPYRRILAPFDGSVGAVAALRRAADLGNNLGAEVTALSVDEHLPRYAPGVGEVEEEPELRKDYFAGLRSQVAALAKEKGLQIRFEKTVGQPSEAIIRCAKEGGFGLIVIGHSSHSGVWRTLLGSTEAQVEDEAPCDVLVVHRSSK